MHGAKNALQTVRPTADDMSSGQIDAQNLSKTRRRNENDLSVPVQLHRLQSREKMFLGKEFRLLHQGGLLLIFIGQRPGDDRGHQSRFILCLSGVLFCEQHDR